MGVEEEPVPCPAEIDSLWMLSYPELMPGEVFTHPCDTILNGATGEAAV